MYFLPCSYQDFFDFRWSVLCKNLEIWNENENETRGRQGVFWESLESLILAPFLHRNFCIACSSSKDWQSGLLATVGKEFLRDWGGLKTRVHSV